MRLYEELKSKTETDENAGGASEILKTRKSLGWFFHDWKRETVTAEDGTTTTRMVYAGLFFRSERNAEERKKDKLHYLIGYLAAAALYGIASTRQSAVNSSLLGIIPAGIALICFALLLICVISRLTVPENMKTNEYMESSVFLKALCIICAAALILTAAAAAAIGALLGSLGTELTATVLYVLAAIPLLLIWAVERQISYETIRNDN